MTVSSVLPAFMSTRFVHAPNTWSARSSRRCSCGTMSLGSSGRVPKYLKPPMTRPGRPRCAMTRYDPSALLLARANTSLRSGCVKAPAPAVRRHRDLVADHDVLGTNRREVAFGLVVAEGPEQARGHGNRRGRRDGIAARVHREKPDVSRLVAHREAGRGSSGLGADDRPLAGSRALDGVRAARQLVDRQRLRVDAVGEPARVRHLVNRVDVLRANIRRRIAGFAEQVQRQVGDETDIPLLHFGRVLAVSVRGRSDRRRRTSAATARPAQRSTGRRQPTGQAPRPAWHE